MFTIYIVSCPARVHLLARNSLVNEGQISWAYSQEVVRTNEIVKLLCSTYNNSIFFLSLLKYLYFFWALLGYTVAKVCASQQIQLGSPDHFSSWEGGVWGRDYVHSTFELFLLLLSLSWFQWWADFFAFFFSQSFQPSAAFSICLCTWFRKIHTLQRASHAVFPFLHHQETLSRHCRVIHVYDILPGPGRECKLTFQAWPQIDILKRYHKLTFLNVTNTYVCTHVHCENRSLI